DDVGFCPMKGPAPFRDTLLREDDVGLSYPGSSCRDFCHIKRLNLRFATASFAGTMWWFF
ncbi:MAG: hypothetical protein V4857_26790, partial [Pseudomonadota bacterium]